MSTSSQSIQTQLEERLKQARHNLDILRINCHVIKEERAAEYNEIYEETVLRADEITLKDQNSTRSLLPIMWWKEAEQTLMAAREQLESQDAAEKEMVEDQTYQVDGLKKRLKMEVAKASKNAEGVEETLSQALKKGAVIRETTG